MYSLFFSFFSPSRKIAAIRYRLENHVYFHKDKEYSMMLFISQPSSMYAVSFFDIMVFPNSLMRSNERKDTTKNNNYSTKDSATNET